MPKQSAGILLYRKINKEPEVLLVHPGGPFFAKKDLGAWSIPKGEFPEGEDPLDAAKREFQEETGYVPKGEFIPLGSVKQTSGKIVLAWAAQGDFDPEKIKSNTFTLEWPPKSGQCKEFPEVDRAEWFPLALALEKINSAQRELIQRLQISHF